MRALVFGGSGTLGREICRCLARDGASIVFTYHENLETASKLAGEIQGALFFPCDLRNAAQVREAVALAAKKLGGLDAVVFAAGTAGDLPGRVPAGQTVLLGDIDEAALDTIHAVNARGVFIACQAAAPILRERGGNIVVIGALSGVKTVPTPVHFAMSKAALKGMVEALSKELGPDGIRVNLVSPGVIEGGVSEKLCRSMREDYLKHCGLGRFARVSEVAEMAAWLAAENTYITGQSILLDGGL